MYSSLVRKMLEQYPAGATAEQILFKLKSVGVRVSATDILAAFNDLSANGEVVIASKDRWLLKRFTVTSVPDTSLKSSLKPDDPLHPAERLLAVTLRCEREGEAGLPLAAIAEGARTAAEMPGDLSSLWRPLLNYYAATQRSDPRGKITQVAERHGSAWQLVSTVGDWWRAARLSAPASALPEGFREALTRQPESTCAIGYPITVIPAPSGSAFLPALIVPARWALRDDRLVIHVDDMDPTFNPEWLKAIGSQARWKAEDLIEKLCPPGEATDLDAIVRRMRNAFARLGGGALAPGRLDAAVETKTTNLFNVAGLFLPSEQTYTRGTAADLSLIADVTDEGRAGTALAALLRGAEVAPSATADPSQVIQLQDLTERQFAAARDCLARPLTVVQGPPGTGKSDLIVSVIASALAAGQSVLFASKNHQALDEVEQRLERFAGKSPILVRGRDAEGERNSNFRDELKVLATGETGRVSDRALDDTDAIARARHSASLKAVRLERTRWEIEIAGLLDRLARFVETEAPPTVARRSLIERLRAWLARVVFRSIDAPPMVTDLSAATPAELRAEVGKRRQMLEALPPMPEVTDLPSYQDEAFKAALMADIQRHFEGIATVEPADKVTADIAIKELDFEGVKNPRNLGWANAQLVLKYRPVWLISTLSVPSRVPLLPGLFDLLVIDEASQCDIASALPLFYRAKRAAVVGDPKQLAFVPGLSIRQENALMDAAGLPTKGRARLAQSVNSLFEFASRRPVSSAHFLADQFRSAPDIVDYLNEEFYDGQLRGQRDEHHLRPVPGYRPGLHWFDVKGQARRDDDGNFNSAEADAVAAQIEALVGNPEFSGTVGALSPFVSQVERIIKAVDDRLGTGRRQDLKIKIATVDRFQGGEADVIFFSPVVTADAPQGATTFLKREARRLNVAISRARSVCVVVGDLSYARSSDIRPLQKLAFHATRPPKAISAEMDSEWERRLYAAMKQRGLDPHPQYEVGRRRLDFALFAATTKLNVEVDGRKWHLAADGTRKTSDILRDREMIGRGWIVRRFWVSELDRDMEKCLDLIEQDLGRR